MHESSQALQLFVGVWLWRLSACFRERLRFLWSPNVQTLVFCVRDRRCQQVRKFGLGIYFDPSTCFSTFTCGRVSKCVTEEKPSTIPLLSYPPNGKISVTKSFGMSLFGRVTCQSCSSAHCETVFHSQICSHDATYIVICSAKCG